MNNNKKDVNEVFNTDRPCKQAHTNQLASELKGQSFFNRMAAATAQTAGTPTAFLLALLIVIIWAICGPIFKFGDTWQLVINTGTTIITFLMVFLIQSTQNNDTAAIQIKLDELLSVIDKADNGLMDLEKFDKETQERIRQDYLEEADVARNNSNSPADP